MATNEAQVVRDAVAPTNGNGQIYVMPVDPLNGPTAMLMPFIAQRIFKMASERMQELDPERFTRAIVTRLWAQDPTVAVLAFVEPNGRLVGHCTAELCQDGVRKWIFVHQTKLADEFGKPVPQAGDATLRAMTMLDAWGRQMGATSMTMATHRDEDAAWKKRFGFSQHRYIMMRDIEPANEA